MTTGKQKWKNRAIDFLIGAVAVLGFAPFHIWPVTILALAYLCLRLQAFANKSNPGRACFGRAFWFALGYFFAGTHWIGSAFIARGPEFVPLMPPMILGLAALLAFFWGCAGWAFGRMQLKGGMASLAFVSLFFIAEWVRGHIFGGLPWNLPGYIFKGGGAISQFASIAGIYGLSWIVLCLPALAALSWQNRRLSFAPVMLILIPAALFITGQNRLSNGDDQFVDDVLIRITQVAFSQKDKFDPEKSNAVVNQFLVQSFQPGLGNVSHLVWPEGAVNGLVLENHSLINFVDRNMAELEGKPPVWLFNSLRKIERQDARSQKPVSDYFNSSVAMTFSKDAPPQLAALNDKHRLVPFGEFIPGGKWMEARNFPLISTNLASISAARKKTLASFPGLPTVSPQICYEIIFPGLTPRPESGSQAEWIINQTNDAWFGSLFGPYQHANMARYRAIEEGLPILRSASNGISGIINPYGNYLDELGPKQTGFIDVSLPKPLKKPIYYSGLNNFLLLLNLVSALLCLAFARFGASNRLD